MFGLSFSLLKAMIKVESDFDSKAVSQKGALGLMQIMPQNLAAFNIRDPYDPRDNILGGGPLFQVSCGTVRRKTTPGPGGL